MTDQPRHGTPPGVPRWVKTAAIITGILIVLFVVLALAGMGGEHGPGRHASGADAPPAGVTLLQAAPTGDPG